MIPSQEINEESAARVRSLERRVARLETLEEGAGCLSLIEDILLTAPSADLTFSDIPQTFKHLWLWDDLLYTGVVGTGTARLRMNGDSGLSYNWIRFEVGSAAGAHVGRGGDALDNEIQLRANASEGGHHEINIVNYTATGKKRQVLWKGGGGFVFFAGDPGPTNEDVLIFGRGTWENTADPITSLSISNAIGVYDAGSRATLYGLC